MQINDELQKILQQALKQTFPELFTDPSKHGAVEGNIEEPPTTQFGDLSTPVCLKLAKPLRSNPLVLAQKLAETLSGMKPSYVGEVTVTPPGYVNFRFDYAALAQQVITTVQQQGEKYGSLINNEQLIMNNDRTEAVEQPAVSKGSPLSSGEDGVNPEGDSEPTRNPVNYSLFINNCSLNKKVVIEHTNINPNKAAHIGHLRNACLGDTLARMLRGIGYEVEVQNYIDDTGTAVADIVVGFEVLGWQEDERSFDYFCWDLYTEINERYLQEPQLKARQLEVLHAIEAGGNEVAQRAKDIADRIVTCHLRSMSRLGIYYQILTWESHILQMGFWKHAFQSLQGKDALVHETEGPNAGCWVVRLSDHPEFSGLENPDKVLVRSNGTATYVAKDIAYQMWKFGVLGLDFTYEERCIQDNGETLWSSTIRGLMNNEELIMNNENAGAIEQSAVSINDRTLSEDGKVELEEDCEAASSFDNYSLFINNYSLERSAQRFGFAQRVINVIDIRQKYLQDVLRISLEQLGYHDQAENSVHFGYEIVSLSAEAAKELGVTIAEDDDKGIYTMAGRKGIGVKADDLLDRVILKAADEVRQRHPEFSDEQCRELGTDIAVGAVRYYMQRFNMNSLIIFDFDTALNMRGNSGPYLQYAHARAHNILGRAAQAGWKIAAEAIGDKDIPPQEGVAALDTTMQECVAASDTPPQESVAASPGGRAAIVAVHELRDSEKELVRRIAELPEVLQKATEALAPSQLADYAYQLAQTFMAFYEDAPVLAAEPQVTEFRLALVASYKQTLANTLNLLGIPALTRM